MSTDANPPAETPSAAPSPAARPCPVCGKPSVPAFRPFCSRGCRDRDLLAWFGEDYRVPGPPADPDGDPDAMPSSDD